MGVKIHAIFCPSNFQVESAIALRSLQPQIKAIQEFYAGDQLAVAQPALGMPELLWKEHGCNFTEVTSASLKRDKKKWIVEIFPKSPTSLKSYGMELRQTSLNSLKNLSAQV
ncbi:hypothetical protein L1987_70780 [Smallanthus sonchifolius]|uniref:Uncharacterized protein n=1 Tax=Smallanthus sonchifolius TaxID=185202 RepID=A0ACB9APR9_9ASTR|nr:hypothetical protein L1987_70780 [Smallanthus sonchifolius]